MTAAPGGPHAATLVAAALLLAGCTAPAQTAPGANNAAERGAAIAGRHCAACHAIDAASPSPHPIAPPFAALAARGYPLDYLGPALSGGLIAGHLTMPPFDFDGRAVEDLRAYLQRLDRR